MAQNRKKAPQPPTRSKAGSDKAKKGGKNKRYKIHLREVIERTLQQIRRCIPAVQQQQTSQDKGKEKQSPKALFMQKLIILGF